MITYQEIQKRDPTAAKLLLALAFFDDQNIQSGMDCSGPPPWFEVVVSSKLVFRTKVKALIKFSLVETKQQEGSYTLHPVVQDWVDYAVKTNHDPENKSTNNVYPAQNITGLSAVASLGSPGEAGDCGWPHRLTRTA
jgi:hypothetical protein